MQEALGEGGMGAVYRCTNAMSERIVAAVKVVRPHSLADERERFVREVEALDALRHRAIVRVKGWGQDESRSLLWLAMEMVDGEDLSHRLARGPLAPEVAIPMFVDLADGLRHAHQKGIHHRDIKPANIVLRKEGGAILVDFGIAVQEGRSRLTAKGLVPGTPAYMAPEIFEGEAADPAAVDMYAIGQVLYEALTGQAAFQASDTLSDGQRLIAIMGKKMDAQPLDPGPAFPDPIRQAVRKATEPDPRRRLPDMKTLTELLSGRAASQTFARPLTPAEMAALRRGEDVEVAPDRPATPVAPRPQPKAPVPETRLAPVPRTPVSAPAPRRRSGRGRGLMIGGVAVAGMSAVTVAILAGALVLVVGVFAVCCMASVGGGNGGGATYGGGARYTGGTIGGGRTVALVELHPEDAYYPYASSVVGLTCVTEGSWTNNGGGYFGGGGTCSDGAYYYFYKVAVQLW